MSDESDKHKAAGGAAPLSAQDALAFMQKMWNPFGMPMPGSTSGGVEPTAAARDPGAAAQASVPPLAGAMPGAMPGMFAFPNPAAMFAALDPAQVERKIAELRVIEGWLAMSLNLMQMSIKTLELQQASLEALQGSATRREEKPRSE